MACRQMPGSLESHSRTMNKVARWRRAPGFQLTLLLCLCTALVFVTTITFFTKYGEAVQSFGDSPDYIDIASAIRHWDFSDLHSKQFWGYPYAMAAVSLVTRLSDQGSLLLISFAASLASILLAYRLWGGWIAGFFAVLNFDWMQRSFLGGSERYLCFCSSRLFGQYAKRNGHLRPS